MTTYRFPNGVQAETGNGWVITRFPDGTVCEGVAVVNEEQHARARSLGYGYTVEGVKKMHREHELLHTVVALMIDGGESHALRHTSKGVQTPGRIPMEERLVFLVQRAINQRRAILNDFALTEEQRQ